MLTKEQIRNRILLRLKTQKEEERERKSKIIKEKLFKSSIFKKAKRVMFYISFDGEVNTREMIKEAQNLGKIVAVPVCKKKRMMLPCVLGRSAKLKKGLYGIYQPAIEKLINLKDLDLVIVPGVAFDKQGNRLGRGKGYYDCLLNKIPKAPSIGLAFDFQILPHLPATTEDVSVNRAIFA
jgi:5-formyltetrahydrofolate cyclo-ligase